jgi:ABC-type glycerol-3-phosphate transport system substrate-binding protein
VALFAEPGASLYLWPIWFMQTIQQQSGGKPTDVTTATLRGTMNFTDPMYVRALQDLADFGSSGALINGFNGLSVDTAITAVLERKAVCNFGIDSMATIVDKATFPVSITPFPTFGSTASTPFGGPMAVTEYAKTNPVRKAAADKLIKYVTTPSFNEAYLAQADASFPIPTATGVRMPYKSDVVAAAVNTYLPQTTVYLDWAWPKSVTGVVQRQVQAVVGGHTGAQDAAVAIARSLDDARANGFTY